MMAVCGCQKVLMLLKKFEKESCILAMLQTRSVIIIWSENIQVSEILCLAM